MPRIAIIGTGLIGTSIGLRLKADATIKDLEVVGCDKDYGRARQAKKLGGIDDAVRDARGAVKDASVVILCTPVLSLRGVMAEIAPALEEGVLVTDTGSTKVEVMRWAEQELPRGVDFIGGHPMAGRTEAGPRAADPSLFEDAAWVVVPSARAPKAAVKSLGRLIEIMGARERFMDAAEHDAYVAAISHLPMVTAMALLSLVHTSEAWPELSTLAAGGFRDATRLAGTDPYIAHDIVVTNRGQIVHWIERLREVLHDLGERIGDEGAEEELFRFIAQTSMDRDAFDVGPTGRTEVGEGAGTHGFGFSDMLLGGAAADKLREINERNDERLEEQERERRLSRNL